MDSVEPKLIVLESGKYDHNSKIVQEFSKNPIISAKNLTLIFAKVVAEGVKEDNSINDKMHFALIRN